MSAAAVLAAATIWAGGAVAGAVLYVSAKDEQLNRKCTVGIVTLSVNLVLVKDVQGKSM